MDGDDLAFHNDDDTSRGGAGSSSDESTQKGRYLKTLGGVMMAYVLGLQTNHVTPGLPRYAEGEPANLIDMSSPVQLYRTT